MIALLTAGLSVTYGSGPAAVRALGPLDLALPEGSVLAVVGPSGSGKSTLLRVLAGIQPVQCGSVLFRGEPVDPARIRVGYIPQDYGLLPWFTVRQNCLLPFTVRGLRAGGRELSRLESLARRLGISELLDRYPGGLSGGQRQRAAVARAFTAEPELLLMDEPFSALDALTREQAQEVFLDLWSQRRAATVLVTHSVEEAAALGGRILVLSAGPGTVAGAVDNPCFGMENPRGGGEHGDMIKYIRDLMQKA